jgi:hypothetical protein
MPPLIIEQSGLLQGLDILEASMREASEKLKAGQTHS